MLIYFTTFIDVKVLQKKHLNIPKVQIYGAAFLMSCIVLIQVSINRGGSFQIFLFDLILFFTTYFLWAAFIDYVYGAIYPVFRDPQGRAKKVISAMVSLLLLALIHLVVSNLIYYGIKIVTIDMKVTEALQEFQPYIFKSYLNRLLDLSIIIIILKIVITFQTVQSQKMEMLSLKNQLQSSQLQTLRYQLNPHFLFNSLHTLNTLIGFDDDKARSMTIKITVLLRKILTMNDDHFISFKEELEFVRNYLDIEQERFHDRLEVIMAIDDETLEVKVPALILQPLVENAFKHGIGCLDESGIIRLEAKLEDDFLLIEIENSIPEQPTLSPNSSTHVGHANLKQRLNQLYKEGEYKFEIKQSQNYYKVDLRLKRMNV